MKNTKILVAVLFSALSLTNQLVAVEEEKGTHRLPLRVIDRPAVMPTGTYNIDTTAKLTGLKTVGVDVASQFGIINKLEGHLSYDGFKINGQRNGQNKAFLLERVVKLGAKYNYHSIKHVSFSATGSLPVHIFDGEIIQDVTLGLPVTFYNNMVAAGILGDLFNLRMRPNIEMAFNFPFWVGVQAYGNWWVELKSSLATLSLENKNNQAKWNSKGLWQKMPLTLSTTYAINHHWDATGLIGFDDTFKAKDTFFFGVTLSYHGGRLFG